MALFRRAGSLLLSHISRIGHGASQIVHARKRLIKLQKVFVPMDQNQMVKSIDKIADRLLVPFLIFSGNKDVPDAGNYQRSAGLLSHLLQQGEQFKTELLAAEWEQFGPQNIRLELGKGLQQQSPAKCLGFVQASRGIAHLQI